MNKINPKDLTQMEVTGAEYVDDLYYLKKILYKVTKDCEHARITNQKEIQKKHEDVIIELLEKFFFQNPLLRQYLLNFYVSFMQDFGNIFLAKEVARIFVSVTEKIANDGERMIDLPLCVQQPKVMRRIGEMTDQAAYVHIMRQMGRITEKPILCMPENIEDIANEAFIPYLEDCYELCVGDAKSKYFNWAKSFRPLSTFLYKFSDTQYGHNGYFFYDCYPELIKAGVDLAPFKLKDITIEKAKMFLKQFGLKETDDFVVLHLRESGYFDGDHHEFRNHDVKDYIPAVEYLLDAGLKVIRIGHEKMTKMFERPGFIDLTKVEKPGEVDIFLSGAAKFYFGSSSGPMSIARNSGTPCCIIDLPYNGFSANTFCHFLKFKKIEGQAVVTIPEIMDLGLFGIQSAIPYKNYNLTPQFSTSSEILQSTKEMMEWLEKGTIYHQNRKHDVYKDMLNIRGGLSSDSLLIMP